MMLKTAFLVDVMVFVDSNVDSNFALKFGDMTSIMYIPYNILKKAATFTELAWLKR